MTRPGWALPVCARVQDMHVKPAKVAIDNKWLDTKAPNAVFVLAVEHWTNSIPSTGCLRVHGSLPNHVLCGLGEGI